ncbi:DUF4062 domain-containing protein [Alicyclobacillus dauci]|uniref:DUF4062 domain-containing protein n=1 Tax=Alicyclobacillus dauci TaxID=1475485 RepID=A0ABY6Z2A6_9BACL|nr:DUF4062 domain-containing protein [Alicyclobacillus dauci]WAH37032.1 DUF4062 domain-containing protein [Alicyclobacillus dauci]
MPFDARVYNILIASPSDVGEDRDIIVEAIHEWNSLNSQKEKTVILPVRWETHSSPSLGDRPQGILNDQFVKNCDLLIGLFWTRIGTHTGAAESGTVEEIEYFIESGKPVLLYFSDKQISLSEIDIEQYKKVKDFRSKIIPNGIVEGFKTTIEFREKVKRHLSLTMRKVIDGTSTSSPEKIEAAKTTILPNIRKDTVYLEDYYKEGITKSFLVKGNTTAIKDELKALGGRWNNKLEGWVFPAKRKIEIAEFIKEKVSAI